jgi:phosphoglycolate phosphatase-like HAD superfamily hydrolase
MAGAMHPRRALRPRTTIACLVLGLLLLALTRAYAQTDPLPSWNDGPAKQAVVEFVRATTETGGPKFVAAESRIATFDNDGTLWVEQPVYTQVTFAFDRVVALAPSHPEWKDRPPFKAILTRDRAAMATLSLQDVEKILAVTHAGMSVDAFAALVKEWAARAKHPRFKRPYTEMIYQPMLEVMKYLRANGYRTYIVTGGGQEFVRAFAETTYGVPPEQVIGSAGQTRYGYGKDGKPTLIKLPKVLLIDDKAGKPEAINLIIGRRPMAAFGNSTGDQQMLEWTQAGDGARLMLLVHHDDAAREYAYGVGSKIGAFPDTLMAEAKQRGWIVVSMKSDWKRIFAFE